MHLFVEEKETNYRQPIRTDEDVFELIHANRENLPLIRFDCGKDDLLIEQNRSLHNKLKNAKIEHIYQEFDGAHEWSYWQEHIKETLLFFNK